MTPAAARLNAKVVLKLTPSSRICCVPALGGNSSETTTAATRAATNTTPTRFMNGRVKTPVLSSQNI